MQIFNSEVLTSLFLSTLLIISSFLGAFFASYMKKKGESFATREDFEKLLEQTKRTTKETELVKQELANHGWVSQQQWQLKERYYSEILENLYKFKITLDDRSDFFLEPGSEHHTSYQSNEHYQHHQRQGSNALEKVYRLSGSGAIVISEAASNALSELRSDQWVNSHHTMCEAEFISKSLENVNHIYTVVLSEAKNELETHNS